MTGPDHIRAAVRDVLHAGPVDPPARDWPDDACERCGTADGDALAVMIDPATNGTARVHLDCGRTAGWRLHHGEHGERPAEPGEVCTCGRPAVTVYTGSAWGDTGYCGREAPPEWGCPWCDEGRHITRCPAYRVRPPAPTLSVLPDPVAVWLTERGRYFPPAPRPKGIRKRADRACFTNAMTLVLDQTAGQALAYAEGVAHTEFGWLHHAWTVTSDGAVLDPTWRDPARCRYFGIVVTDPAAHARRVLETGHPSLFADGQVPAFLDAGPDPEVGR